MAPPLPGRPHAQPQLPLSAPRRSRPGRAVLSDRDRRALQDLEQHPCAEAPVLDLWLRTGARRGLPDQPRASYTVQAWPVLVVVAAGCALSPGGASSQAHYLLWGAYLVAFSFLGLWLPLRSRRGRDRPP